MSITVKQLSNQFSYLKFEDFKYLTGKSSNIKDDDTVSLGKLAAFNKKDIQIFAARKEGVSFLGLLKGENQVDIAKGAGIKGDKNTSNPFGQQNNEYKRNPALGGWIPPEKKTWIG